jgi:hypothetical protein
MEKHVEEFKKIFERLQYNEDYSNKSTEEKKEILEIAKGIQFRYLDDIGRFKLKLQNPKISHIIVSPQLCYTLGYETVQSIKDRQVAKYAVDLHGGVSHLCVYLNNGLIVSFSLSFHCNV